MPTVRVGIPRCRVHRGRRNRLPLGRCRRGLRKPAWRRRGGRVRCPDRERAGRRAGRRRRCRRARRALPALARAPVRRCVARSHRAVSAGSPRGLSQWRWQRLWAWSLAVTWRRHPHRLGRARPPRCLPRPAFSGRRWFRRGHRGRRDRGHICRGGSVEVPPSARDNRIALRGPAGCWRCSSPMARLSTRMRDCWWATATASMPRVALDLRRATAGGPVFSPDRVVTASTAAPGAARGGSGWPGVAGTPPRTVWGAPVATAAMRGSSAPAAAAGPVGTAAVPAVTVVGAGCSSGPGDAAAPAGPACWG